MAYVKLECFRDHAMLSKTNLANYCIHRVIGQFEPCTILIDEKLLSALLSSTPSPVIDIDANGNNIIIDDAYSKITFPVEDVRNYPEFPENEGETKKYTLSGDVLQSIGIARNYVMGSTVNEQPMSFVIVKNSHEVFASNNAIIYFKKFKEELPDLILYPECCNALSNFDEAIYYTLGQYDFFDVGTTTYGFIKPEQKQPAYERIITMLVKGGGFSIAKPNIERFCELAINATASAFPESVVKDNGDGVTFKLENNSYDIDATMNFDVIEKDITIDDFHFNPKIMLPVIKPLPYQAIHFTPNKFGYIITTPEDENYSGIISALAKN